MERRTFESPMEWEYESAPPVDLTSPFAKMSQKAPICEYSSVSRIPPRVFQGAASFPVFFPDPGLLSPQIMNRISAPLHAATASANLYPSQQLRSTRPPNSAPKTQTLSAWLQLGRPHSRRRINLSLRVHSSIPSYRTNHKRRCFETPPSRPPKSALTSLPSPNSLEPSPAPP